MNTKYRGLPEEGDLRKLMRSGAGFVYYRLPGEGKVMKQIAERVHALTPEAFLQREIAEGFVFVPFQTEQKLIWFDGDHELPGDSAEMEEDMPADNGIYLLGEDAEIYIQQLNDFMNGMRQKELVKAVFSGRREVAGKALKGAPELFARILKAYPEAFVYFARIPGYGLWMGASPEGLLRFDNGKVESMALAGTKPLDKPADWTDKEFEEHRYVSEYILGLFKQCGCGETRVVGPYESRAGNLLHLRTDFQSFADFRQAMKLAFLLHPTPAVCGVPVKESMQFILENEGYSRQFYTGFLGPVSQQKLDFFVNLRCAKLEDDRMVLFAGGGITLASHPLDEWKEARSKSETIAVEWEKLRNFATN